MKTTYTVISYPNNFVFDNRADAEEMALAEWEDAGYTEFDWYIHSCYVWKKEKFILEKGLRIANSLMKRRIKSTSRYDVHETIEFEEFMYAVEEDSDEFGAIFKTIEEAQEMALALWEERYFTKFNWWLHYQSFSEIDAEKAMEKARDEMEKQSIKETYIIKPIAVF